MALDPSNSSNLEQLAVKGLNCNVAGRTGSAADETTQLGLELWPGDDVNDEVVGVDERIETVKRCECVLHDQVPLSYVRPRSHRNKTL